MEWTKFRIILALLMVASGSILTITTKGMNKVVSMGENEAHEFNHPFVQADLMFIGEFLSFLIFFMFYKILTRRRDGSEETNPLTKGSRTFNPLILWAPALMDVVASSMMYIGLTMTNASSYQMLRGSVIIFTAALTKNKIKTYQWVALVIIIFALVLSGLGDFYTQNNPVIDVPIDENSAYSLFFNDDFVSTVSNTNFVANHSNKKTILIGDGLIIAAQFIVAHQMVFEEKYVASLDIPPLLVVGWEGIFGFAMTTVFLLAYGTVQKHDDTLEEAFEQIKNSWELSAAVPIMIIATCVFNSSGVCVTKEINATTRMVLDTVRTLTVWIFSLCMGWQKFHWLQLVAFIVLTFGTFLYNNILILQSFRYCRNKFSKNPETDSPMA